MSIPLFVSGRLKPELSALPISVGCLIFERMDQIDFTGPFEVLSRMPDTTVQIIGKGLSPVRDVQGLLLSPDMSIAEAGLFDVLLIPGGYGQQALPDQRGFDAIDAGRPSESRRYQPGTPAYCFDPTSQQLPKLLQRPKRDKAWEHVANAAMAQPKSWAHCDGSAV